MKQCLTSNFNFTLVGIGVNHGAIGCRYRELGVESDWCGLSKYIVCVSFVVFMRICQALLVSVIVWGCFKREIETLADKLRIQPKLCTSFSKDGTCFAEILG